MMKVTMIGRGGRAGWFRIASGFSALASLGGAYQAWSVSHPSADAVVFYAPPLGAAIGVGAALFAGASVLAMQHRAIAGLCLLIGYAIPAGTLYAQQATIIPPSPLIVVSMIALIMATRRTAAVSDPAA
jgi:hypothetical protein